MFEWSDTDLIMRDTVRGFIDKEIRPHLDALETGELSPYPIARKLFSEFGLDVLAAEAVKTMLDKERAKQAAAESAAEKRSSAGLGGLGPQASMAAVLVSELAGVSLGLLSTVGVSLGLGAATIMSRGTLGPKGALAAGIDDAREDRGVGDHRAGLRLGRVRRHEDNRQAGW